MDPTALLTLERIDQVAIAAGGHALIDGEGGGGIVEVGGFLLIVDPREDAGFTVAYCGPLGALQLDLILGTVAAAVTPPITL